MKGSSIGRISDLFELQTRAELSLVAIDHPLFRDYCFRLRALSQEVKEFDDDCWKQPIRKLRHYRFDMCAAPLSFGTETVMSREKFDELQSQLMVCCDYYSETEPSVRVLLENLKKLVESDENPLLSTICNEANSVGRKALLLKESRHIKAVQEVFKANEIADIEILSQQQLKRLDSQFDTLLCIGSTGWFSEYIFRAPRASKTKVIQYAWLPNVDYRRKPLFKGWEQLRPRLEEQHKIRKRAVNENNAFAVVDRELSQGDWLVDEEMVPRFDLSVIENRFRDHESDNEDNVVARLFELEGGRGVFLENSGRADCLESEESGSASISRVDTSSILPGMFVLLRGDSSDDSEYIVPIADRLLGKNATTLRDRQQKWKSALRALTRDQGYAVVVDRLRQNGSRIANEINLRNWLSPRNIKTEAREDFFAIMRVIGMRDVEEKYWDSAGQIDRAHLRAGGLIRRELRRQVKISDVSDLDRLGEMKFELEEVGGKPLLALRVVRVSEVQSNVSRSHINKLFELGDV